MTSGRRGAAAAALAALVFVLSCAPTIQRGPQFYFTNTHPQPQQQSARFVPSTFQQPASNQYQGFFQPLHTAPGAFAPFRAPAQQDPAQQQFQLQGFHQQGVPANLQPSPFQLPPNSPGQAQPQHYSTFQTINPPAGRDDAQVAPPAFFQPQPDYRQFAGSQDPSSNLRNPPFSNPTPSPPRQQSFLDQITLSPSGFSGTASPRDPNNLRLLQNFNRPQPPALVDQFSPNQPQKRPQSNFDGGRGGQRTPLFSQPFPPEDDVQLSTYVDQHLEVEDSSTPDPRLNAPSRQKDRKPETTLRKKPSTRAQPGSRNNVISPQRARPASSEYRGNKAPQTQNDSFHNDAVDDSPTQSSRTRGRNRYHTTTTTTAPPPTRGRNRFVPTTKPPHKVRQFNVRPSKTPFAPKRVPSPSTAEPEGESSAGESGEILYDEAYDQLNNSQEFSSVESTTKYNVTTFRYQSHESNVPVLNSTDYVKTDEAIPLNTEQAHPEINSGETSTTETSISESTPLPSPSTTLNVQTKSHLVDSAESLESSSAYSSEEEEEGEEDAYHSPSVSENPATVLQDDEVISVTEIPDGVSNMHETSDYTDTEDHTINEHVEGNGTGAFEILTMNPQHALVEQDNFKGFVDSVLIDATETPHVSTSSSDDTTEEPDEEPVSVHSTATMKRTPPTTSPPENNEGRSMEEAIVSVVTTKSVINGTSMIVTVPPVAQITGQMTPPDSTPEPPDSSSSSPTESWVIIASVQTSRSVSGARFLPPIIRQEERILPLSGGKPVSSEKLPKDSEIPKETSKENVTNSSTPNVSTESIIDKLDRVQSELSSGILTGGEVQLEVLTEKPGIGQKNMNAAGTTTSSPTSTTYVPVFIRKFTPHRPTPPPKKTQETTGGAQTDDHHGLSTNLKLRPGQRTSFSKSGSSDDLLNRPQGDQPALPVTNNKLRTSSSRASSGRSSGISSAQNKVKIQDVSALLPPGYKPPAGEANATKQIKEITIKDLLSNIKFEDVSSLLPPGFNLSTLNKPKEVEDTSKPSGLEALFSKTKQDDISALLPPGFKEQITSTTTQKPKGVESLLSKVTQDDISAFLPPGFVTSSNPSISSTEKSKGIDSLFSKVTKDDISAFLPPGYVTKTSGSTTEKPKGIEGVFNKAKQDDISAFLPPGYVTKSSASTTEKPKGIEGIFSKTKQDDISAFLPPGYNLRGKHTTTTEKPKDVEGLLNGAKSVDISAFLPPDFKLASSTLKSTEDSNENSNNGDGSNPETTTKSFKVKFPSVPGMARRTTLRPTTTTKSFAAPKPSLAPIQKGWPTRATTAFTGWPTPSTTPISIEKLLEAAKTATTTTSSTTSTSTTTTTTTTTTTPQPTTPGVCVADCDLAATIKLVGSEQWVPELLDHNTREWQDLANEVQTQLDSVYSKSDSLSQWYRKVRIDDFSEGNKGSVLVDYFVELTDLGRQVDTQELKRLFHDSLTESASDISADEIDAINDTAVYNSSDYLSFGNPQNLLKLGNFVVDPKYTDFIVLPKRQEPTVGYAEEDVLVPQWAIAGIVIGLASLLFVIIFGVTVLVNRHKNNKKKQPVPLTEDMLNELNKNHMGGLDNYAAEDLYNMEDVWNEKPYDKPPKKRSSASLQENSMSNLYDSWRSEWNGYYYNAYYGNGSSASGYTRRRSDYDTNF